MPFTATDLSVVLEDSDNFARTVYTTAPYSFVPGKLYLLLIGGIDDTAVSGNNAIGVPTSSATWANVNSKTRDFSASSLEYATVASPVTESISLTFPTLQTIGRWLMLEIDSAEVVPVQSVPSSGNPPIATLPNPMGADGLAIGFFSGSITSPRSFTVGAGHTALTGGIVQIFAEYNLIQNGILDVATPYGGTYSGVGVEIAFSGSIINVTSVNGGAPISDGDTGVTTLGNAFGSPGVHTISPSDNINDVNAVVQTDTSWTPTAIDITVSLPVGSNSDNPVFVFVTNDSAETNAIGFPVSVLSTDVISIFSMKIDDGVNPVLCTATDFDLGVTAYLNKGLAGEEIASLVVSTSNANTAQPQFKCTFSKAPVNLVDTITVVYDNTVGDIQSVADGIALLSGEYTGTVC